MARHLAAMAEYATHNIQICVKPFNDGSDLLLGHQLIANRTPPQVQYPDQNGHPDPPAAPDLRRQGVAGQREPALLQHRGGFDGVAAASTPRRRAEEADESRPGHHHLRGEQRGERCLSDAPHVAGARGLPRSHQQPRRQHEDHVQRRDVDDHVQH
eukprot:7236080-Heterocapsa_arctica.AAC.1